MIGIRKRMIQFEVQRHPIFVPLESSYGIDIIASGRQINSRHLHNPIGLEWRLAYLILKIPTRRNVRY